MVDFGDAIRAGKFETVRDYLRVNPDCFHQKFKFDLLLRRLKTETEGVKKSPSPIKEDESNSNVKLTKLNNTSKEKSFEKEKSKLILSTGDVSVHIKDDSEDVVDGYKVTRNN